MTTRRADFQNARRGVRRRRRWGDASERGPSGRTRGGARERAYPLRSQRSTERAYPSLLDPRTPGRAPRARPSDDEIRVWVGTCQNPPACEIICAHRSVSPIVRGGLHVKPHRAPPRSSRRFSRAPRRGPRIALASSRASRRLSRPEPTLARSSLPLGVESFPESPLANDDGAPRPQRGMGALPGHGRGPQRRGERV